MSGDRYSQTATETMGRGSEMPLLPWGQDGQLEASLPASLSPRLRPATQHDSLWSTTSQLTSLLSASSYPLPDLCQTQSSLLTESREPVSLYGGVVFDRFSPDGGDDGDNGGDSQLHQEDEIGRSSETPPSDQSMNKQTPSKQRRTSKPSGEAVRKRGRPRKSVDGMKGEDPEERRRMQVRMAQRAYRSRKEASISSLRARIAELESAVEQMNTAVMSFGDELACSGALKSHPQLAKPLQETVQSCIVLPTISPDAEPTVHSQGTSSSSASQHFLYPSQGSRTKGVSATEKDANWSVYRSPSLSSSSDIVDTMEIPDFIDRLHIACRYQAYLLAANPSVPLRRIEAPFRMLLSIMPRESIAAYFKDWLLARANKRELDQWDHVPYFCVGGAGTHYPAPAAASFRPDRPALPHQRWLKENEPLARFPMAIQEDLDEDWFDLQDLEGFLRDKHIILPATPPTDIKIGPLESGPLAQTAANITRLIQCLISRAMCLGRTPGFRRRDVESALEDFRNASLNIVSF